MLVQVSTYHDSIKSSKLPQFNQFILIFVRNVIFIYDQKMFRKQTYYIAYLHTYLQGRRFTSLVLIEKRVN